MRPRPVMLLWLIAYVLTMAALVAGLYWARATVIDRLGSPAALAEWREWKAASERLSQQPGPVARRPVRANEPPALILMRDNFVPILVVSLTIGSFLFAFLGLVIRGSLTQQPQPVDLS